MTLNGTSVDGRCCSTLLVGVAALLGPTAQAQDNSVALQVMATAVRTQGFPCEKPSSAERNAELSKPNMSVWLLTCESNRYRVEIIPKLRARITKLD
ncbi:MAG: hypothetical protein ABWZ27_07355 [Aestuariivirgaceae bacterium]|jgi:hypothetical protein